MAAVEAQNPCSEPTSAASLAALSGDWRLLYTTVTIRGSKRTKLGLRGLVTLGELVQSLDAGAGSAANTVAFAVAGGSLRGSLRIDAAYRVVSPSRVAIEYQASSLEPAQLQAIFLKQLPLLLEVFNPAGWLELTYVDAGLRVGRDDKGCLFVLERA